MKDVFVRCKNALVTVLNYALMGAVLVLVSDVVWGVFTRYVIGKQASWTEELARFVLIWVAFLGSAVAFGTKGHLGVDYFVEKFHPDVRKLTALMTHSVVLFFAVSLFLYGGGRVVADALAMEQTTPALGWKTGYVYMALPVSGVFIVLFTIENLIETWITPAVFLHESDAGAEVD
jgi:TRAP-type C4-dicarboxylate transport system permease small subunit